MGEKSEDQKDYYIRLKTTDKNGSSYENSYVINFSNNTFREIDKKTSPVSEPDPIQGNAPTGITIGENPKNPEKILDTTATTLTNVHYKYLFSIDADIDDDHTYSFISGKGDKDNELLFLDNESGAIALATEMKPIMVWVKNQKTRKTTTYV